MGDIFPIAIREPLECWHLLNHDYWWLFGHHVTSLNMPSPMHQSLLPHPRPRSHWPIWQWSFHPTLPFTVDADSYTWTLNLSSPPAFLLTFTDANSASNLYYLIPEDITSHDFLLPTHCFRPCPNSYPTPFETWCCFCSTSMLYLIVESRGQHGLHCSLIAPSFGQAGTVSGSSLLLCTSAGTASFSLLLPLPLEGTSTLWSTTLKIEAWGTSLNGLALGLTKCERLLQY